LKQRAIPAKKSARPKTAAPPVEAAPVKKTEVKITPAKGRPMLTWVGKRPLTHVTAFPAQHVETFDPHPSPLSLQGRREGGLLFHGDNKEVLAHLLANGYRGKVNLIYIDPPFDSGADYVRKVQLRGASGAAKLDGESYTLGEQIQYTDIWANDNYLQFMYERLLLLKELLMEDGSIFLHCDWRKVHLLRNLMDEAFGSDNFVNEIVWKHTVLGGTHGRRLPKAHETVLWYGKSQSYKFNDKAKSARVPFGDYIKKTLRQDEDGRWYYTRGRMSRQPSQEELARKPFTKTYVDDPELGTLASDIWDDLLAYRVYGDEDIEYPTQKNESLVERFVELGSSPGDLILDCFIGSGTTAAVAQKLGRRWIGCDINKGAIQTTSKRLQAIIREQIEALEAAKSKPKQGKLLKTGDEEEDTAPEPAQLGFTVWRVNDYDLQIQHNEAVNLACEHIGVERSRADAYFDGALGKSLVKIVPFGHPLSPLDLEDLKRELEARPDEDRPVTLVCLGIELAAQAWIDDWNRLRKSKNAVNRIQVIELRTDPRYGRFIKHEPASARVRISRKRLPSPVRGRSSEEGRWAGGEGDKIAVEIENFISPTIIERLEQQAGLLKPRIDDWRAMVDCVMIDPAYDGKVFNVALSDVPEKKTDLVAGRYELNAPKGETTVAVKIIDMLGEEVSVTTTV
jgi:DNA modification methylase